MEKFEDDKTFAKVINYMQKALYHKRIDYFRKMSVIKNEEISIEEITAIADNSSVIKSQFSYFDILNQKEIEVLKLHYECGFKYEEIANMKNSNVNTVRQIRNRAMNKVRKKMEEKDE